MIIDEFIDTSRYVYNRTLEYIENGHKIHFQSLRDLMVTKNTKKNLQEYKAYDKNLKKLREKKFTTENKKIKIEIQQEIDRLNQERRDEMKSFEASKNHIIRDFEMRTPKEVRAAAVKQCVDAHKASFTNLKNGNIKFFHMNYKKKTEKKQTIELASSHISIKNQSICILPLFFKNESILAIDKQNKRRISNLEIQNNVDLTRIDNQYWLHLCVETKPKKYEGATRIGGFDPGVRSFGTGHTDNMTTGETLITEYNQDQEQLKKINRKIMLLRTRRNTRKKHFNRAEKKKKDLVDKLHWDVINDMIKNNDVIYYGDIKSHDIVKNSKIKFLNTAFNDLKFYQFKQRLIYKASLLGKKVISVPEHYTTKTCSCCGTINDNVGSSKVFECQNCMLVTGRDMNAAKNMKMKGLFI